MRSMDCFDSFGFEEEYNEVWYPYGDFLQKDLIEQQKLHLRDTGINLGESNLKFIYTSEIAEYEDLINKAYGNLRCENWGVSICNEVFYTNKIEGAQTTIARTMAIHNGAAVTNDSERMILNGFNATKYLNLIQSRFLSAEELVKLWEITVQDVCQNESVRGERWRNGSVSVGAHEGYKSG